MPTSTEARLFRAYSVSMKRPYRTGLSMEELPMNVSLFRTTRRSFTAFTLAAAISLASLSATINPAAAAPISTANAPINVTGIDMGCVRRDLRDLQRSMAQSPEWYRDSVDAIESINIA